MTPTHLLPDHCFVCGGTKHGPKAGHAFLPNAQAEAELAELTQGWDDIAARFVAEHRPY